MLKKPFLPSYMLKVVISCLFPNIYFYLMLPSLGGVVVSTPVWHWVDPGSIPKVGCLDHGFRGFHGYPRRMLGQYPQVGHERISLPSPSHEGH